MRDISTTAHSAALWYRARSTPAARQASSSCSRIRQHDAPDQGGHGHAPSPSEMLISCWSMDMQKDHRAQPGDGKIESMRDAVCLATGGYANVFFLSRTPLDRNVTAAFRAYNGVLCSRIPASRRSIDCIPVTGDHQSKLTLSPSRSGTTAAYGAEKQGRQEEGARIPNPTVITF